MPAPSPPLDALVDRVRSAIQARRLKYLASADALREALEEYTCAVDARLAREFAEEHRLKLPPDEGHADPLARAKRLLQLVEALPELATLKVEPNESAARSAETPAPTPPHPQIQLGSSTLRHLSSQLATAPLVVVGGVAHPERLTGLQPELRDWVDWVETTRQGTHAIGNLERRIRDRRVCALLILEGVLAHKHFDPLVAAARQTNLPCAYAGRGGKAALKRALEELDSMFCQRSTR